MHYSVTSCRHVFAVPRFDRLAALPVSQETERALGIEEQPVPGSVDAPDEGKRQIAHVDHRYIGHDADDACVLLFAVLIRGERYSHEDAI